MATLMNPVDATPEHHGKLWVDTYITLAVAGTTLADWRPPPELTLAFGKARSATFDIQLDVLTGTANLLTTIERTITDSERVDSTSPWKKMQITMASATIVGRNRVYLTFGPNGVPGDLAPRGFGRLLISNQAAAVTIVRVRVFVTIV